ncbi:hypothetical protein INT47_003758 [Mucor saturninus]|uniref:Uncharacterized protein n=1 Tax=Mucor saturninus TaxID=64648 RepID=A0A8H7V9F8_9FUNG|nr:hypothetical protein INT47_003758 [Mucor saturninus]
MCDLAYHLLRKKIAYNEQKRAESKNAITALAQTRLRYQSDGLKALTDSATSSRRVLTLTNALTDASFNASINDATSSSPTDDKNNPLVDDTSQHADDTIEDNDGFLFPGDDDIFSFDHRDFQLHRLTYKKMIDGRSLNEKEIVFLQNLTYDGKSVKGVLQQYVATKLLSDNLSFIEEEAVKVHLSGIVNLIHSGMSKVILSSLPDHLKTKLDYIPKVSQLDPDTLGKRDESEARFYRRFASILETLLADTDVILADGETSLQSSKVAIAMNKAIFHTSDMSQAYGRKIDMILKCSSNVKVRNSGYLYLLRLVDDGLVNLLLLVPTTIESLDTVKDTLRGILTLKEHLVSIAWKVKSELHKLEHASVLEDVYIWDRILFITKIINK